MTNQEIANRYKNVEPLVKVWISQHEKNKKIENNLVLNKLKDLTLDLKYEIISFIPTYSNTYLQNDKLEIKKTIETKLLQNKNFSDSNNLQSPTIDNNYNNNDKQRDEIKEEKLFDIFKYLIEPSGVKEECKFTIDNSLITFHKMRLINKEFNLRMKLKLLTLDHLDLNFIIKNDIFSENKQKGKLCNLITLLKQQRIYSEYKENILEHDNERHFIENLLQVDYVNLYDGHFSEYMLSVTDQQNSDFIPQEIQQQQQQYPSFSFGITDPTQCFDFGATPSVFTNEKPLRGDDVNMSNDSEERVIEKNELKKEIDMNSLNIFELSSMDLDNLENELTKDVNEEQEVFVTSPQSQHSQFYFDDNAKESFTKYSHTVPFIEVMNHRNNDYYYFKDYCDHIDDFIGNNKTIKSIQLCNNLLNRYTLKNVLESMLTNLQNLTTITILNLNIYDPQYFVLKDLSNSVKEVNLFFITSGINFVSTILQSPQFSDFENLVRINVFPTFNNELESLEENFIQYVFENEFDIVKDSFTFIRNNPTTGEKLVYFSNNINGGRNIEVNFTFGHDLRKEDWIKLTRSCYYNNVDNNLYDALHTFLFKKGSLDVKMKKWLLEYWIQNNYLLVEQISFGDVNFELREYLCLLQYLIYLTNEYQNGRLFNVLKKDLHKFKPNIDEFFLNLVKYGYSYEKQMLEIYQILNNESVELLPTLLSSLPIKDEQFLFNLVQLLSFKINNIKFVEYFLCVLFKTYGEEIIKKMLLHPIYTFSKTNQIFELPFIVHLSNNETYLLMEWFNLFTSEEILSINHEGNNLCQLLISKFKTIDNRCILKIIEKTPKLLYTKNDYGETLLHTCCLVKDSSKASLAYCLIKDYGLTLDQHDNKGRAVKYLLENDYPLIAKLLFNYEGF